MLFNDFNKGLKQYIYSLLINIKSTDKKDIVYTQIRSLNFKPFKVKTNWNVREIFSSYSTANEIIFFDLANGDDSICITINFPCDYIHQSSFNTFPSRIRMSLDDMPYSF